MNAILLLPALVLAQTQTQTADPALSLKYINPLKDFIQISDKAYALLPPTLVSDGRPSEIHFSSNGQAITFLRHPNRPAFDQNMMVTNPNALDSQSLCECSLADQKVKDLLTIDGRTTVIEQIEWLHESDAFLVVTRNTPPQAKEPTYSVYRLSGLSDPQELYANSIHPISVEASPSKPLAIAITSATDSTGKVHQQGAVIENDGTELVPITNDPRGLPIFDGDGNVAYFEGLVDAQTKKRKLVLHPIDLKTGEPQFDKLSANQVLGVGVSYEQLPAKTWQSLNSISPLPRFKASIRSQWLRGAVKSDYPVALIAADSEDSTFSPAMNAVAYVTQGTLFVREMLPVDLTVMKAMMDVARKEEAMSQAKQVGVACMMYAADYDGQMPPLKEFATQIDPYVKNPDLVNGFTYTNTLSSIPQADAATTIVGFVQTGTGKAVVYGDGHVAWMP